MAPQTYRYLGCLLTSFQHLHAFPGFVFTNPERCTWHSRPRVCCQYALIGYVDRAMGSAVGQGLGDGIYAPRSGGPNFDIPPASLQGFIAICILIFIPIYDCLLVPFSRNLTGKPSGISVLQRIGTGLFISIVCMVVAALIEKRRLDIALHYGLIDLPTATIPMTIWWLLPQYAISGIADAFTIVGLQEFFYDQVPVELRSVGMSLYLTVLGIGSLLSSILVSLVDKLSSGEMGSSWLSDNLNTAHLDYFYWLLAGLSTLGLVLFMYFSK